MAVGLLALEEELCRAYKGDIRVGQSIFWGNHLLASLVLPKYMQPFSWLVEKHG